MTQWRQVGLKQSATLFNVWAPGKPTRIGSVLLLECNFVHLTEANSNPTVPNNNLQCAEIHFAH